MIQKWVTYGGEITFDDSGNAVFGHIPHDSLNAPTVYFKQTGSDGSHNFSKKLQSTTMSSETLTVEITNSIADLREFTITDAYYEKCQ